MSNLTINIKVDGNPNATPLVVRIGNSAQTVLATSAGYNYFETSEVNKKLLYDCQAFGL